MAFWSVPNRTRAVDGENGIELYGDFQADEVSDLATTLDGVTIAAGSIAQIIQTGDFVTLGENGSWYAADGSGAASTPAASVQSTRGLTKSVAPPVSIANSLLDIEPQTAEYVEPEEIRNGGEHR